MLFVSRQRYYYSGEQIVEVELQGGLDYAGADMLTPKYAGEAEEYADPREAFKAAIKIRDAWRADSPGVDINIGFGSTHGIGLEFEPTEKTDSELLEIAEKLYEKMPKCDQCGDILNPKEKYILFDDPDFEFCSNQCAERFGWELNPVSEE